MPRLTFAEATRRALAEEMRRDPTVWALGEDLAQGGIFGQYRGLIDEFGPHRIVSTPISEACIMGAGLGAALCGTRPIIEMRIADFTLCAMDELVSQIAKARYMFGGQARAALVVRMPGGTWRNSAAQHSQCLEAWLAHIPGLVVAAPGTARVAREGGDVTVVTWAATVPVVEAAAEACGVPAEVIDLRGLWPWDEEAVVASAARTRRLLVVHEAVTVGGFGAEVVARVVERLGPAGLRAAERLGAPRVPAPFSPALEDAVQVTPERVAAAIRRVARA